MAPPITTAEMSKVEGFISEIRANSLPIENGIDDACFFTFSDISCSSLSVQALDFFLWFLPTNHNNLT
jgi:hypothetical protein